MFGLTSTELVLLLAAVPALASPVPAKSFSQEPEAVHIMQLTRHNGIPISGSNPLRNKRSLQTGTGSLTELNAPGIGLVMSTEMKFNNQTVQMVVDTGSSDTWVVGTKFQCQDVSTKKNTSEGSCMFASTYDYTTSKTFQKIPNLNFNITYNDGEYLTGIVGKENVTLAGITVNQEISVVNKAAWFGDSFTSGLVGMSFPAITSVYTGNDPKVDGPNNSVSYNPIFTTMWQNKLVAPLFSMAITRSFKTNAGGVLAIGGLPPNITYDASSLSHAPLQKTCTKAGGCTGTPVQQYYAINLDSVQVGQADPKHTVTNITAPYLQSSPFQAVVDSGTSDIEIPTFMANAINALFNPPAVFNASVNAYVTSCSATAPAMNVQIGGKKYNIDSRDMLLPAIDGLPKSQCLSAVNDGGDGPYLLGDVFMRNVLSVFDVGANEMRFYSTNV